VDFHRPFHRSVLPSIAYAIAYAVGCSVVFPRYCSRVCSITPHPYGVGSAALGLEGPRRSSTGRREQARRADRPRHRRECSNARSLQAPGTDRRQFGVIACEWTNLQAYSAPVTVTRAAAGRSNQLPRASHRDNRVIRRLELLRFSSIARCYEVTGMHREGVFACGLPHSRLFIGSNGVRTANALAIWLNWLNAWDCQGKRPHPVPWHPPNPAPPIIDLLPIFRGSSPKNCCLAATKTGLQNFGGAIPKNPDRS
jgi:hypothetical protein